LIAIIDYGVGNLGSVEKAMRFIGLRTVTTSDPGVVRKADAVVLPGVGAYFDGMSNLEKYGMAEAVREVVSQNRLFLGICLGLQLLFDYSEEGGKVNGLGLFKGAVKALPGTKGAAPDEKNLQQGARLKVPHMGWNSLMTMDSQLFKGLPDEPYVYFVHSYYLEAVDRSIVAATCEYGVRFDAAISSGRVFATQFHPEKSGEICLTILKNWAQMA